MTRTWAVIVATACLLVGFAAGWATRRKVGADELVSRREAEDPRTPAEHALGPPRDVLVDGPKHHPPDRPPEFVGVIESVQPEVIGGRVTARLYIRCETPPAHWPQPTDQYQRDGNRLWVSLHGAEIDQKGGLAPGSVARVWHDRKGQMRSEPPGYIGLYVQTESAFR